MGWAIIFDFRAFSGVPSGCLGLVAAGGVLYSIGAVFYIVGKPNRSKIWRSHEIFHLFVIGGSFCHFVVMYWFI